MALAIAMTARDPVNLAMFLVDFAASTGHYPFLYRFVAYLAEGVASKPWLNAFGSLGAAYPPQCQL